MYTELSAKNSDDAIIIYDLGCIQLYYIIYDLFRYFWRLIGVASEQ